MLTKPTSPRVATDNHCCKSERVAIQDRTPRQIARLTPIAEATARTANLIVTGSFVEWGSYVREEGTRNATNVARPIAAGPILSVNRISARVRALTRRRGLFSR